MHAHTRRACTYMHVHEYSTLASIDTYLLATRELGTGLGRVFACMRATCAGAHTHKPRSNARIRPRLRAFVRLDVHVHMRIHAVEVCKHRRSEPLTH